MGYVSRAASTVPGSEIGCQFIEAPIQVAEEKDPLFLMGALI